MRDYNPLNIDFDFLRSLNPLPPSVRNTVTLSQQVESLACKKIKLEGLAGEMLATVKINFERGYLKACNDEGKLNLEKILADWERQLKAIEAEPF